MLKGWKDWSRIWLWWNYSKKRTTFAQNAQDLSTLYEIAYTLVDFLAATFFIIGSVFFFDEKLMTAGTWLFLIGSILFATKPTLRLLREIQLYKMGEDEDLAEHIGRWKRNKF